MLKLDSSRATLYSCIIFLLSVALNYFLPDQPVIYIGFIISIFLTIFIETQRSTVLAGFATVVILLVISAIKFHNFFSFDLLSGKVFILAIFFFTTIIVLYTKRLLRDMRFDKTHMTSLFENATEGIILTNGKGEIVLVNPSAENVFGYKEAELTGKLIEVLIPQRFTPGHDKMRKKFYEYPKNRQMGIGRDLFARKKNGTDFPVEVSLSHYKLKAEDFVIAFVVDITARKNIELNILKHKTDLEKLTEDMHLLNSNLEIKVEQRTRILTEALQKLEQSQKELNEALNKEKELNEIKSRFLSMASHEFRTPLSTVLSSASLLAKYTVTEEQHKRDRHINRIKESVKHLNDILEEFLSLGKLDEGKVAACSGLFNLNELLGDVVEEMKAHTGPGQKIEYFYEGNTEVHSDNKLVRNIVINLISNAIKFSEKESIISVAGAAFDNKIMISVKDEGIGISPEDQPYLYTSFFRGKNAVNIQGTGLGLHIVKRYLELLNGTIYLQTALHTGSTFTIVVPVPNKPYEINSGDR